MKTSDQKQHLTGLSIAATDELTSLIAQPAFIPWKTFKLTGVLIGNSNPPRVIHSSAIRVFSVCSCLHLMLVTGERLVAIKFTMPHPYIVTRQLASEGF